MPGISALCPHLAPRPSRALRRFLIGVHALALPAAWLNPLPVALRLGLSLAIAWSLWRHLGNEPKNALAGLRPLPDGGWRLSLPGGAEADAQLLGESLATPWFVLLRFRTERGPRRHWLVCRDSLDPEDFRRLRVALRVAVLEGDRPGD